MSLRYRCYFCASNVVDGVGHELSCPTQTVLVAAPVSRCDCGSPDAHWQFCKTFTPYEKRDAKKAE